MFVLKLRFVVIILLAAFSTGNTQLAEFANWIRFARSVANVHVLHDQVRGAVVDEAGANVLVREN